MESIPGILKSLKIPSEIQRDVRRYEYVKNGLILEFGYTSKTSKTVVCKQVHLLIITYVNAVISFIYTQIWACETHAQTYVNIEKTCLDTVGENYSQSMPGGDIPPIRIRPLRTEC